MSVCLSVLTIGLLLGPSLGQVASLATPSPAQRLLQSLGEHSSVIK